MERCGCPVMSHIRVCAAPDDESDVTGSMSKPAPCLCHSGQVPCSAVLTDQPMIQNLCHVLFSWLD